jgi:hypothetical protein
MADYYPLISEAIAALDKKTGEGRIAFYERARTILVDKLRRADPPLSETIIDQERLALEDAISKAEADAISKAEVDAISKAEADAISKAKADAMESEGTPPMPSGLQTQSDHEDVRSAALEAAWVQVDAKVQMRRERRLAFWGFLIVYTFWMGDVFYERPKFSDWYDWARLDGVVFFGALTILSYFIMRENWSTEQEKRAYIVLAPTILLGAVLVTVALYFAFGRLA